MQIFDIIPDQASTYAESVDRLFYFLVAVAVVMVTAIFSTLAFMAYRYRHVKGVQRRSHSLESTALEVAWTVIPTVGFLAVFVWGLLLYLDYAKPPVGALEIDVVAKQWMWKIQHPDGRREINELHIPVGRPIQLTMISQDVIHDFFVPAFRVKQDVLPGRYTKLWFEPTKVGEYHLFCAEYCGTNHSRMGGTVYVMEPEHYVEWLGGGPRKSPQEAGAFLFEQRGCASCHSGKPDSRGPGLEGLYGTEVELTTGTFVTADDDYLRESIFESSKKIVEGYSALMPSFKNQLTEEEGRSLIAYIKSLSSGGGATE